MDGELICEIVRGIEGMAGIEAFLILTVAAVDLAVVSWRIRANELVPDTPLCCRLFKECRQIAPAIGKTVGKLKAVICLNTFYLDAATCIPRRQLAEKVRRGVGRLLRIGGEEA